MLIRNHFDVTAQQLIEMVLLQSGGEHLSNMRQVIDETPGIYKSRRNNPI